MSDPMSTPLTLATCRLCAAVWLSNEAVASPTTPETDERDASYTCPTCRRVLGELRRVRADGEPLGDVSSPPIDERAHCLSEPVPGLSYCALAYLVYNETGSFAIVPQGEPTICPHHFALLYDAVTRFYGARLTHDAILATTRVRCEWWMAMARRQANRIEVRYSR